MAELFNLDATEGLHIDDGAGIDSSDSLDQRNLVAGESKSQTVGFLGSSILVSSDKDHSYVSLAGHLDGSLVNRSILRSLVYEIYGLGTVVTKLEGIGLHRHAGAVNAADACT